VSIKIATALKAKTTENFKDGSGKNIQKMVIPRDSQIEQHHTHERIPAKKPSGIPTGVPFSSCIIPASFLILTNRLNGPVSRTKRDAILQIARP
jgi:hypothetical protein